MVLILPPIGRLELHHNHLIVDGQSGTIKYLELLFLLVGNAEHAC